MERGGICPYCGHDARCDLCETYHRRRRWVSERPNWWPRRLWWRLTGRPGRWEYESDACVLFGNSATGELWLDGRAKNEMPRRCDVLFAHKPDDFQGLDQLRKKVRDAILNWDLSNLELCVSIGECSYETVRAVIEELTRVGWDAHFGKRRESDSEPCITIRW